MEISFYKAFDTLNRVLSIKEQLWILMTREEGVVLINYYYSDQQENVQQYLL
jgi:hypothetical protein